MVLFQPSSRVTPSKVYNIQGVSEVGSGYCQGFESREVVSALSALSALSSLSSL